MTVELNQMRAMALQAFDLLDPVADLIDGRTVSVSAFSDGTATARVFFWQEGEKAKEIAAKIPLAWKKVVSRDGSVSYIGKNGTIEVDLSGVERITPIPNEEPLFPDLASEQRKELIASV